MMTRSLQTLAALLLMCLALPVRAQGLEEAPEPKLEHVAIDTALGTITLALDTTNAPVTAGNFLRYVDEKRYDGTVFYRVMRLDWGTPPNGLIQGGTRGNPQRNRPGIAHEPTNETGITHKLGAISMARLEPGSAAGDFSIMVSPQPGLDAQPGAEDETARLGYAAFGWVVDGMSVVRAIYDVPLSLTEGEGFLRGQMIEKPVPILKMRRVPPPAPPEPVAEPEATPPPAPDEAAPVSEAVANGF